MLQNSKLFFVTETRIFFLPARHERPLGRPRRRWEENVKLYLTTLFDLQLDAQNSYLFTLFIKILYIFRALPCSSSGGLRRKSIYAASGIVTVCR